MIKSMTGYGDADGELNGVIYIVEIKSVNNRYFKPRIKLPESAAFIEEDIFELLRKDLLRGAIEYTLKLKRISADMLYDINSEALKAYLEKLKEVTASTGISGSLDVSGLLTLPGILEPVLPGEKKAKKVKEFVIELTERAIEKLKQMRVTEGAELLADLKTNCQVINKNLENIRQRKDTVMQDYHQRLSTRTQELLTNAGVKIDEETIAREVAVYAERCDISEEIARLESHLKQFEETCESNGQAGRRLDFIGQEMLREANTIGSKASDVEIAHCVVNIKCGIDRIKEQVQNVE